VGEGVVVSVGLAVGDGVGVDFTSFFPQEANKGTIKIKEIIKSAKRYQARL
jgi:hypothetical protein